MNWGDKDWRLFFSRRIKILCMVFGFGIQRQLCFGSHDDRKWDFQFFSCCLNASGLLLILIWFDLIFWYSIILNGAMYSVLRTIICVNGGLKKSQNQHCASCNDFLIFIYSNRHFKDFLLKSVWEKWLLLAKLLN